MTSSSLLVPLTESPLFSFLESNYLTLLLLFPAGLLNNHAMETLNQRVKEANVFNTFIQTIFTVIVSYIFSLVHDYHQYGYISSWIPYTGSVGSFKWFCIGTLGFFSGVLPSMAVNNSVPVPSMNLLKSANLIVNMLVYAYIFKNMRLITSCNIIGTVMITLGIFIIGKLDIETKKTNGGGSGGNSSNPVTNQSTIKNTPSNPIPINKINYVKGVFYITLALVVQSLLSNCQSQVSQENPQMHWTSNIFYSHFFGSVWFILYYRDISRSYYRFSYISGVNMAIGTMSPLALNVLLSMRKLISVFISNRFSAYHMIPLKWIGVFACTFGTVIFFI